MIPPPRLPLVCGDKGSGKASMLSPRALGTRARDFRTGHPPAFHVEPDGARGRGYHQVRIGTELTVTGLRRIELAALQILPGVAPDCGD